MIPLILRLKRLEHKEIAKAQDLIIEVLYGVFGTAVLHGGTAIWRCYRGNRFSEDVDVCIAKNDVLLESFFSSLEKKGFVVEKKKITEKGLFSNLLLNKTAVRLEAIFISREGMLKEYETADGNFITVYTLSPEDLIKEKVDAYLGRRKVRDLYDVFFLLRYADRDKAKHDVKRLLDGFKEPLDGDDLKVLILEGIVPTVEQILQYLRRS